MRSAAERPLRDWLLVVWLALAVGVPLARAGDLLPDHSPDRVLLSLPFNTHPWRMFARNIGILHIPILVDDASGTEQLATELVATRAPHHKASRLITNASTSPPYMRHLCTLDHGGKRLVHEMWRRDEQADPGAPPYRRQFRREQPCRR